MSERHDIELALKAYSVTMYPLHCELYTVKNHAQNS